jgi:hypothetical protein
MTRWSGMERSWWRLLAEAAELALGWVSLGALRRLSRTFGDFRGKMKQMESEVPV